MCTTNCAALTKFVIHLDCISIDVIDRADILCTTRCLDDSNAVKADGRFSHFKVSWGQR